MVSLFQERLGEGLGRNAEKINLVIKEKLVEEALLNHFSLW